MNKEQLIYDIGFHKGEDTALYLKMGYNVVAVEANPILVEMGKKRFENDIKNGRLVLLNLGIASESESGNVLPFYVNKKNSQWSSFDFEIGTRNNTPYYVQEIQTVEMKALMQQYGIPFYIKIDIEGYDKYVLEGLPNDVTLLPKFISCEATEFELIEQLYALGYKKFKLINQGNGFKQINLKQEGKKWYPKYVHYYNGLKKHFGKWLPFKYEYGASGPFGETSDGDWQNFETIKTQYFTFYAKNNPLNNTSWFDFHACL